MPRYLLIGTALLAGALMVRADSVPQPATAKVLLRGEDLSFKGLMSPAELQAAYEEIKSPAVLLPVIRKLELTHLPGAGAKALTTDEMVSQLSASLVVQNEPGTNVIAITLPQGIPNGAAIVNGVAETYKSLQDQLLGRVQGGIENSLSLRIDEQKAAVDAAEATVHNLKADRNPPAAALQEAEDQLARNEAVLKVLESQLGQTRDRPVASPVLIVALAH